MKNNVALNAGQGYVANVTAKDKEQLHSQGSRKDPSSSLYPAEASGKCVNKKIHVIQAKNHWSLNMKPMKMTIGGGEHSTSLLNPQDIIIFIGENRYYSTGTSDANIIALTLTMK